MLFANLPLQPLLVTLRRRIKSSRDFLFVLPCLIAITQFFSCQRHIAPLLVLEFQDEGIRVLRLYTLLSFPYLIFKEDIEYILRILEKFEYCIDDSVQIVKCNEGTMNIPDYEKMKKSKKIYHADFKFLIDLFNEDEKRQYNQKEAASLFFYCLGRESKENLAAAKKELLQYRPLNKKEKVSLILTSIGTKNHNLFCITQPVFTYFKNRNCNNKMCRRIDAGILRELKELSVI